MAAGCPPALPSCLGEQVLLCYFLKRPISDAPSLEVPLHTVIELQPTIGGPWIEHRYELVPPSSSSADVGTRKDSRHDGVDAPSYGGASEVGISRPIRASMDAILGSARAIKEHAVSLVELPSLAHSNGGNAGGPLFGAREAAPEMDTAELLSAMDNLGVFP